MTFEEALQLPAKELYAPSSPSLQYGADALIARHCGIRTELLMLPQRIRWQHGWSPMHMQVHPVGVLQATAQPGDIALVARHDEAEFLRSNGFRFAHAIGLPIVYVPERVCVRRPRSLLVMPAHSLPYTTHQWRFDEYVDAIDAVRDQFDEVAVCVHPACFTKGYWVRQFSARGYPVIVGTEYNDRKSLHRLSQLLRTFEFVTTNRIGSQLAYASYLGAKASIYGEYAEHTEADHRDALFYRENPYLLSPVVDLSSERVVRQHLPEFFCRPDAAVERLEWGAAQVGAHNRPTPETLREWIGWSPAGIARKLAFSAPRRAAAWVSRQPTVQGVTRSVTSGFRRVRTQSLTLTDWSDEARVAALARNTPSVTTLRGHTVEFVDPASYIEMKRMWIDDEQLRFCPNSASPYILDVGADIGLSVIAMLGHLPRARIVAFEDEPLLRATLKRNLASFGVSHAVEVVPADGLASSPPVNANRAEPNRVVDYLDAAPVDLLKLDWRADAVAVLSACAGRLDCVRRVFIQHRSLANEPQTIAAILARLTEAGFRLQLKEVFSARQPLLEREPRENAELELNIFAFRL